MASSTTRTILKYLRAVLERYTPLKARADSLEDIYNYLPLSPELATSGQPTEEQFDLIREAGFHQVINLAPAGVIENSLEDEADLLRRLEIRYTHIPVNFQDPTEADFRDFVAAMEDAAGAPLWVHCAANARVSAFIYRYRVEVLGEAPESARVDLVKIWEPFGPWKKFLP